MLRYQTTPVQEVHDERLQTAGVRLLIKREDLNHPYVSGNKWWKLKYNLEEAIRHQYSTLLTFGGAYSNHIFATAAASAELNLKSIGLIRGEPTDPLNPTLRFAQEKGMALVYLSRHAYRSKQLTESDLSNFGNPYVIPEGGTNALAVKGVREYARTLTDDYQYLCCPVGTGGTISGLIEEADPDKTILGFSVLKQGDFLIDEIHRLSEESKKKQNWQLIQDYHFGGYAKQTLALKQFIDDFTKSHNIPLEFVYTGKMMAGIYDLVNKNFFERGSTILAIHTGGLQLQR